jgi:hypothetical protein
MNAWAPVCIEALKMRMDACVQMLEHHRKDIISVNEDAVEFKKDFPELDIPRNYVFINDTRCKEIGYRQYVKRMYDPTRDRFLDIYKYRDSGDNMITGLIKIL